MSTMAALAALRYLAFTTPRPDFQLAELQFTTATLDALRPRHPLFDTTNPDLSAFAAAGGKLIIWHGVNDESMSYRESLQGYEVLRERFADADQWVRYVAIPGLWHCRAGTGPSDTVESLLGALISWVEKGVEPTSIEAHRYTYEGGREKSFLLCTEPRQAFLRKAGLDPKDAANWECREPPS